MGGSNWQTIGLCPWITVIRREKYIDTFITNTTRVVLNEPVQTATDLTIQEFIFLFIKKLIIQRTDGIY